jgi:phosphoribosylanthranilate isomerase
MLASVADKHSHITDQSTFDLWRKTLKLDEPEVFLKKLSGAVDQLVSIKLESAFTNKPTRLINGGNALTISKAVSTSTWREQFDWSLAKVDINLPIILAGGLTPDTVSVAIRQVNPYAVDS